MEHSLVYKVLKAKYYPLCGILDAEMCSNPSFTWRNLCQARWVVEKGSHWLVGDGWSLNIRDSRWVPMPTFFKIVTPVKPETSLLRVGDLIDRDRGGWNYTMGHSLFLPMDVETILNIPLCTSWPQDKLIWNCFSTGGLSGKMTYHLIMQVYSDDVP